MSANPQRPPDAAAFIALPGGLDPSTSPEHVLTLADLPVGARLVLRCRKDWRDSTVTAVSLEEVTLSVGAPSGRTYRVRRPSHAPLSLNGSIPVLGEGLWRVGLVRYDVRW
ncbi:MAG TPA: hypothetical protein VD966_11715 [Pyrinomonadaceae bacterium]|nr:hypothetical protein [Pyrinomonadaceae bacterium]